MEAWFPYTEYVTNYKTLQFILSVAAGMCIKIQNLMNWFILDQKCFTLCFFNFSPTYKIPWDLLIRMHFCGTSGQCQGSDLF